MLDPSARAVIVFNGEIYNFRELRRKLEEEGHRFRGHSDTEVLLTLYLTRGEAMLPCSTEFSLSRSMTSRIKRFSSV